MTKINMSGSNVGAKGICAVIDANGTVLPCLATDNGDGTATLKIDTEISASLDPTGLATSVNQTALIAKFPDQVSNKVPVIGPLTDAELAARDPATQTTLAAILAKIIAAPATEAKQDSINGKLAALVDSQAPVVAGYKTKRIDISFTAIGAYSQYDVVGALVEVPNWATANGRSATIKDLRLTVNNNAIAPQFEVHFFRASDVTIGADNATWTELEAEYAKRAGFILMPACAKATGSGTIDFVRAQHPDAEYGIGLSREITCSAASTSIWVGLKIVTAGISFAGSPGNTIRAALVVEQS